MSEDKKDWEAFDYSQVDYDEDFKPVAVVDAKGQTPELLLKCLRLLVKGLEDYVANPNG